MHRPTAGGRTPFATALAVLLVLLLVAGPLAAATAVGAEPSTVPESRTDGSFSTTATAAQATFDRSTVSITVFRNGSARWEFRYVRPLENESEVQEFESYAQRFNTEETELYRSFRSDSRAIVARGQNVTDREMSATDFSRHAEVQQSLGNDLGVVTMSFTWVGFADASGSLVEVGDVFEGGLYLGPDQTLVFHPGPGLVFTEVLPDATWSNASSLRGSDSVTWEGEKQFTDNRPYVALEPAGADGTTPDATDATPTPAPSGGVPTGLLGVALTVLLIVAGVGWYHRNGGGGAAETATEPVAESSSAPVTGQSTGSDETPATPTAPPATEAAGTAESAAGAGETAGEASAEGAGESTTANVADERLLSDEGRVVALLETNDGQMKQSAIVDETGWSKSKVSMLLSDMADEGRVEKLRLGRENVITLAEGDGEETADDTGDGAGENEEPNQ